MKSASLDALLLIAAIFILFWIFLLTGCSVSYPLGEAGKYGAVRASVTYVPPVNLWLNPAPFLADK